MAERVFINDLNPITDIQDGAKILVDQNGYKKMFYEDFVIDIAGTLKSEHGTGWNADFIGGTDVSVEVPQQGDVLIFNSSTNEFENRFKRYRLVQHFRKRVQVFASWKWWNC